MFKNGALADRFFRRFVLGFFSSLIGRQMLTVAIGWEIYERTHSALALGYIGLAQLLPIVLLTLVAGHVADNYDRRKVLIFSQCLNMVALIGLFALSISQGPIMLIYGFLAILGIGRAFQNPANAALIPEIVDKSVFTNAVAINSIALQTASILGPALSGLLIAVFKNAGPVYLLDFFCILFFSLVLLFGMKNRINHSADWDRSAINSSVLSTDNSSIAQPVVAQKTKREKMTLTSMMSGLAFVWKTKIILAAISLDLFAVLFGGATALLPVFAKDILQVGPTGLGGLQMADSLGAILMGIFLMRRAARFRKAGVWLLCAVSGFGLSTIIFGLSKNFALSMSMLFLTGLCDNVSVVIRQALVQLQTPNEMRGRVSAINYVFIGTSNELGGFESGLVAHWFGAVNSVVFGGVATLLVVLATFLFCPPLRKLDQLDEP